ncbi:MAG TPA: FAD-dependent oxidoreductase, partial [Acidimicrobiia bacterium]|nr:FAD-dependent oxidoreductase [Acidimicrobiia bacterium]
CQAGCLTGGDPRGWIGVVAQREKLGFDDPIAFRTAWEQLTAINPFPAVLGRICPHPCQTGCNRNDLDAPVAINALERYLGDWGIDQDLRLPIVEEDRKSESVAVIGAGPSGLSFAYQMARRGYPVVVYDRHPDAGGMLRYGVPDYRLPPDILDAEVARIADLGVEFRLGVGIGEEVALEDLRDEHDLVYVAIGAQRGRGLGVPGDDGPGVWSGVEYLGRVNQGERIDLGRRVAVVGGGNTAVDAARTARRTGAAVTMLYRRTRAEMPAVSEEIDDALAEGIEIEFLVAPIEVRRSGEEIAHLLLQRMELGEPDASGRRRPLPIEGSEFEMPIDTVIAAVSQHPDWDGFHGAEWSELRGLSEPEPGLWVGGDAAGPGLAGIAIAHGRSAAEAAHARLRGLPLPVDDRTEPIRSGAVKPDFYEPSPQAVREHVAVEDALADPDLEVSLGLAESEFLAEVERCFSCGLCFGCRHCFMYCTAPSFTPVEVPSPGNHFTLSLEACRDCGKCIDVCPCGYLEVTSPATVGSMADQLYSMTRNAPR